MDPTTRTHAHASSNIREWLRQNKHLGVGHVADELKRDQALRWRRGERVPVEEHLQLLAEVAPSGVNELALNLIYGEFVVRRELGESPTVAEFTGRFPHFAPQLQLMFGLETNVERAAATKATVVGDVSTRDGADAPAESALPVGAGYEVLKELGRGGMGVVYEAREQRLGRVVALKTARLEPGAESDEARTRFLSEARIAARLEHPGVVPVHELVTPHDGEPFYTMKLVRGRTLADAIHEFHSAKHEPGEQAVARRRLLETFLAICRTMAFAHNQNVIHRDLKPANVVIGEYGETVILDWGLAKVLRADGPAEPRVGALPVSPELTVSGTVMGTPAYMSPEQAAGSLDVDERSDIYALGAILYHILAGRHPHRGSGRELLMLIQEAEPTPPSAIVSDVARPLEAICLKAMAKRRQDRYPTAQHLADDVERFLAGEPVSAYRERRSERLARWTRRHRTFVAVGVVAGVLSVIGIAAGIYLNQRADYERRAQATKFENQQVQERLQFENKQEQERQRQAFAEQRRQEQDRQDRVERAASNEKQARSEVQTGRFRAAEHFFEQGVALVRGIPGLERRVEELETMRKRARQVADFYRLKDRADMFSAGTSPEGSATDREVVVSCETALSGLGVLREVGGKWWERLPDGELTARQKVRLVEDTASVMVLLASWRLKLGLPQPGNNRLDPEEWKEARRLLTPVRAYYDQLVEHPRVKNENPPPPGSAADVLELFTATLLGDDSGFRQLTPNPRTADDAYFMGVAQVFIAWEAQGEAGPAAEQLRILRRIFDRPLRLSGLDLETPRFTAERFFRMAVTMYPEHYWAHFSIGQNRLMVKDWPGAEEAFNACIALRPDHVSGYTNRFRALREQAMADRTNWDPEEGSFTRLIRNTRNAAILRERAILFRRALDGLDRAPPAVQVDAMIRWQRFVCQVRLGEASAYDTAASALEVIVATKLGGVSPGPEDAFVVLEARRDFAGFRKTLEEWIQQPPNPQVSYNLDLAILVAGSRLADGEYELAAKVASWVTQVVAEQPRARAIVGMARLKAGRFADALKEFDVTLSRDPNNALALTGRALALEQSGESAKALAAFAQLLPADPTETAGPLHLVGLFGQARMLAKLGKEPDARQALQRAREIDPVAADALAAKLFPAPK